MQKTSAGYAGRTLKRKQYPISSPPVLSHHRSPSTDNSRQLLVHISSLNYLRSTELRLWYLRKVKYLTNLPIGKLHRSGHYDVSRYYRPGKQCKSLMPQTNRLRCYQTHATGFGCGNIACVQSEVGNNRAQVTYPTLPSRSTHHLPSPPLASPAKKKKRRWLNKAWAMHVPGLMFVQDKAGTRISCQHLCHHQASPCTQPPSGPHAPRFLTPPSSGQRMLQPDPATSTSRSPKPEQKAGGWWRLWHRLCPKLLLRQASNVCLKYVWPSVLHSSSYFIPTGVGSVEGE